MKPRTIAIGDIHGCSAALDALLGVIRVRHEDTVVTLGDYIDRGPDSRGVLDRLIDLGTRCRLIPILGNHDQTLLDAREGTCPLEWLLNIGGTATLDSYGPGLSLSLVPEAHYRFLETCHDFHEDDQFIFTHANYYPDLPMIEQPPDILRWESLGFGDMRPGPHESGKAVIVGHTSQKSGEILDLGHLKCIDTFCYGGRWLTALDVDSGEAWQASRDGEIRRR